MAGIAAITPMANEPYPQLSRRNDTSGMLTPRARPTLKTDANTAKYVAQRMFHAPVDCYFYRRHKAMWERAFVARGFIPVGSRSGPKTCNSGVSIHRLHWLCDCFAAER